jgi:threonine/homoserine/homoserine lactone efflux protein
MDTITISFFWKGLLLGMHAGFAPGPVSTLLVTESLLHGRRAGMKIAFVPFLTDVPVVALIIPLLYCLTFDVTSAIAVISMIGSLVLFYLGYESLTVTEARYTQGNAPRISLLKAIGANFFNPNLYIYWVTICGPLSVSALRVNAATMIVFLIVFYTSITLTKMTVALAVGTVRRSLNLTVIIWINRFLGAAMFLFAVMFFWQGVQMMANGW